MSPVESRTAEYTAVGRVSETLTPLVSMPSFLRFCRSTEPDVSFPTDDTSKGSKRSRCRHSAMFLPTPTHHCGTMSATRGEIFLLDTNRGRPPPLDCLMVPMFEVPRINGAVEELIMSSTRPPTTRTRLPLLALDTENSCRTSPVVRLANGNNDSSENNKPFRSAGNSARPTWSRWDPPPIRSPNQTARMRSGA